MKPSPTQGAPAFIMRIRDHKIFAPLHGQGLKALALKGSVWTIAGFGIQKIIQFSSNLILTRLLFPEAFGTMALITVFIVALAMFSEIGIKPAIIQNKRGEDPDFLNTAWTIQVIRGFVIWLIASLIAWPISKLYGQPVLFPLLCFVSITAAIQGFQSTALATRNRNLQLGLLTIIQIITQLTSVVLMISLAWNFRSVWSLAAGGVAAALVNTILSHVLLASHRHRFHIEREALHTLLNFGKWILLTTLVGYFGGHGIRAIQGLLVTPADLGIIYIASMIAWAIGDLTQSLSSLVGFPVLSQIARENPARLRNALAKIRLRLFVLALPGFIILSLFSPPLIDVLYDERYIAAGRYLAILSLSGAISILSMGYGYTLLSIGDSKTHFIVILIAMILRVCGLLIGFNLGGIEGMLLGVAAGTLLNYFSIIYRTYKAGWLTPSLEIGSLAAISAGAILTYFWNFAPPG